MKLFFQFSRSHEQMLTHYFLPSAETFEIGPNPQHTHIAPQLCKSGEYGSPNWPMAMAQRVQYLAQMCRCHRGQLVAFTDVDVQFFGDPVGMLKEQMQSGADLMLQRAKSRNPRFLACFGFGVMWCNERTQKLFDKLHTDMRTGAWFLDYALNNYLMTQPHDLHWELLPDDLVWSPGKYDDVKQLKPPANMRVHHANCCVGVAEKMAQLHHVKGMM